MREIDRHTSRQIDRERAREIQIETDRDRQTASGDGVGLEGWEKGGGGAHWK